MLNFSFSGIIEKIKYFRIQEFRIYRNFKDFSFFEIYLFIFILSKICNKKFNFDASYICYFEKMKTYLESRLQNFSFNNLFIGLFINLYIKF